MTTRGTSVSAQGLADAARNLLPALRATTRVAAPVLVVAVGLAVMLGPRLVDYQGNPTGFILFGRQFVAHTHPPPGALVRTPIGYDGQFYWIQARDPLVLRASTLAEIDATGRGYDLQRMAYPALAAVLAAGQQDAIPWSMLAVNVLAVLAITAVVAAYARSRGRSVWWGLAVGLTPGLVMGTLRDLSDPLATAAMLGGLVAYERGRRWPAAVLLTLGALAREPMIVAVVAVGADLLARLWQERSSPGGRRRLARSWPVLVLPAAAFIGWQVYTRGLTLPHAATTQTAAGSTARAPAGSDTLNLPPFNDFSTEVQRTLTIGPPAGAIWDLSYIAVVLMGMLAALAALRRGPWAPTVTAILSATVMTVIFLGDQWGVSRYGAPLLGALVLIGLRTGLSAPMRVSAAAVFLTPLIAVMVPGV